MAEKVLIQVWGYRCERCGWEWVPRKNAATAPRVCPQCKSPYWDRPRRVTLQLERRTTPPPAGARSGEGREE